MWKAATDKWLINIPLGQFEGNILKILKQMKKRL